MGLFRKILNIGGNHSEAETAIAAQGFEASDCLKECSGCSTKFPSSVKVESDGDLWGSTKPFGLHLVVPTNKTDWDHDACSTEGTIANATSCWGESHSIDGIGQVKVNVSSLCSDELLVNDEYALGARGDILVLPFFVWIKNVTVKEVDSVLSTVVGELAASRASGSSVAPLSYPQFPSMSFENDPNSSYVFLCSHKTRDKRCGITAPIMKKEMEIHLRELGLHRDFGDHSPGGVKVTFINHVGGHKFSANVIIYLKRSGKNIWLARCSPSNVRPIIDECIVNDGKVWPDMVRIVQKFDPIEW